MPVGLSFGLVAGALLALTLGALAAQPLDIGSRKQLFIDDRLIDSMENVTFTMNPPIKAGTVMVADRPWEGHRIGAYGTVMEDGGVYKLWYDLIDSKGAIHEAYAMSTDGIRWGKPDLGIVEYEGSKANNLINVEPSGTVFIDPTAPPEQRYKYVTDHWKVGMFVYWSADGLHWTRNQEVSLPLDPDTQNQAFYDPRIGKYVAYLRGWNRMRVVVRCEMDDILQPWPYQPRGKPFQIWGKDQLPTPSTELPTVFAADKHDPPNSDFYNPAVVQYPYAQDAYVMFPSAYRHFPEPPAGKYGNDGLLDIHLAVSRDGIKWSRVSREPYVRLGRAGEPDSGMMYMLVGMLRRGDELWQYYFGYDYTHGDYQPTERKNTGALVRVVQRLDGFVSADAAYEGGTLVTKPVIFEGKALELNIDTAAMGTPRVALLDEQGKELPGHGIADCDAIGTNSVAHKVTWKGSAGVSRWAGEPVRVKLEMRATKLYAMRFVG